MSGQPAARMGDTIGCVVHGGAAPIITGAPNVLIGGRPAARVGDNACAVPDPIVKGAFTVPVAYSPAARMGDVTSQGGVVAMGCFNVLVGLAGTAGNVRVGNMMFDAAASTRVGGSASQSYGNCGVESTRQIMQQALGITVSEDHLIQWAIDNQLANGTPNTPPLITDGGTNAFERHKILDRHGVRSTVHVYGDIGLGLAMSRGQGVIANVDAMHLWGGSTPPGSLHSVVVTGVEYDDQGNMVNVIINDTGVGDRGQVVPIATWNRAVQGAPPLVNVTDNPIF